MSVFYRQLLLIMLVVASLVVVNSPRSAIRKPRIFSAVESVNPRYSLRDFFCDIGFQDQANLKIVRSRILPPGVPDLVSISRRPSRIVFDLLHLDRWYGANLEGLSGDSKVLDVGAGTSEMARYLGEEFGVRGAKQLDWWYGIRGKNLGVILDSRIRIQDLPAFLLRNQEYLIAGVAQALPFEDESMDLVLSTSALNDMTDANYETAILECLRILKKGGRFILFPLDFLSVRRLRLFVKLSASREWLVEVSVARTGQASDLSSVGESRILSIVKREATTK